MPDRFCTWYVDPLGDPHVNAILAENCASEDICQSIICADGERRNLWRCTHKFIADLLRFGMASKHRIAIYRKIGTHGKITLWIFENPKRKINPENDLKVKKVFTAPF
jgi:hypothetical protein